MSLMGKYLYSDLSSENSQYCKLPTKEKLHVKKITIPMDTVSIEVIQLEYNSVINLDREYGPGSETLLGWLKSRFKKKQ